MEDKLKELDIPFLYVADYLEESPLGKGDADYIGPVSYTHLCPGDHL